MLFRSGLNKSDYQDCEGHDRKAMDLPYNQDKLITAIAAVNMAVDYNDLGANLQNYLDNFNKIFDK